MIAKSTTPNISTKNLHFSRISWIEINPRLKKGGQPKNRRPVKKGFREGL